MSLFNLSDHVWYSSKTLQSPFVDPVLMPGILCPTVMSDIQLMGVVTGGHIVVWRALMVIDIVFVGWWIHLDWGGDPLPMYINRQAPSLTW